MRNRRLRPSLVQHMLPDDECGEASILPSPAFKTSGDQLPTQPPALVRPDGVYRICQSLSLFVTDTSAAFRLL